MFARAMLDLLQDPARLAALRAAGLLRATGYTWRRAAAETLAVYRIAAARLEGTRSQKSEVGAFCKTPTRTVGTEPDPPGDGENGLFSTIEGRPPCRPRKFCKRLV